MGFNPKSARCHSLPRTAVPLVSVKCGLQRIFSPLKMTILLLSLMVLVTPAFGGLISADFTPQLQLPDCSEAQQRSASLNSLVFVSTIDGRLSALDGRNGGTPVWSIETGPGPLLSSSIHNLELTKNGHLVRMIPSLSGGLYKFNGENVEVIPVTADDLLHSSVRFGENLVMTGGKELRNYGIDVLNGKVLYECSLRGCENATAQDYNIEEVLLVQRKTQTVRAIDARTSYERWNFSVAHHSLSLVPDPSALCHSSRSTQPLDLDIRIIAPEGLVCGISRVDKSIVWKHKFESPVVGSWVVDHGEMREVDLFAGSQWTTQDFDMDDDDIPASPSLYVGMHKKQLYIQESVQMQRQLNHPANRRYMLTDETNYPQIPWKPVPATSTALGLPEQKLEKEGDDKKKAEETTKSTAMSVLYGSVYVNGNGFFLFSKDAIQKKKTPQCDVPSHDPDNGEIIAVSENNTEESSEGTQYTPEVLTVIAPFWYWWKEIILISMTSALILNVIITQRFFNYFKTLIGLEVRAQVLETSGSERRSSDPVLPLTMPQVPLPASPPPYTEYTSRYLQEFQPVRCLGRGGFGVVFEARKKFDDCLYAVKRISLTNKEESRERVLREVKALAKLDHNNIVRYFNSWLEQPPPGWQQIEDSKWSVLSADSGSEFPSVADEPSTFSIHKRSPVKSHKRSGSVCVDIQPSESGEPVPSNNYAEDPDDSFIVFAAAGDESKSERLLQSDSDDEDTETSTSWLKKKTTMSRSVCSSTRDQAGPTSYLFIQMQLCQKESLKEWLRRSTSRDYNKVLNFFEQIVQAVEYVHLNGLIHRDLKPSNIFFSMDGQIKIGDFGLVTTMLEDTEDRRAAIEGSGSPARTRGLHTAQVGTELYMSPEQRAGLQYNYKVDIYSLGLILFELLVPFFTEMERINTLQGLRRQQFPDNFDKNYEHEHSLLTMMLAERPEKRPTTFGIRSRPPLKTPGTPGESSEHHFELPSRSRSFHSSSSSSGSIDSSLTVISDGS